jgi:hypothetical protein
MLGNVSCEEDTIHSNMRVEMWGNVSCEEDTIHSNMGLEMLGNVSCEEDTIHSNMGVEMWGNVSCEEDTIHSNMRLEMLGNMSCEEDTIHSNMRLETYKNLKNDIKYHKIYIEIKCSHKSALFAVCKDLRLVMISYWLQKKWLLILDLELGKLRSVTIEGEGVQKCRLLQDLRRRKCREEMCLWTAAKRLISLH